MKTENIRLSCFHSITYVFNVSGIREAVKCFFSHRKIDISLEEARRYISDHKKALATPSIKRSLQLIVVAQEYSLLSNPIENPASVSTDKPEVVEKYSPEEEGYLASAESEIQALKIADNYLDSCGDYAKYLIDAYPPDTHKILTIGQQCIILNAFLIEEFGRSDFGSYIFPRNFSALKIAVVSCISKEDNTVNVTKLNKIFDKIIPDKEGLEGKTLVISRVLCLLETMILIKPYLKDYLENKGILYHFDLLVSSIPNRRFVDTDGSDTTTEQYHANIKLLEADKNVTVWKAPSDNMNADSEWYDPLLKLDVDCFKKKELGYLNRGESYFIYNYRNKSLLRYLRKRNLSR